MATLLWSTGTHTYRPLCMHAHTHTGKEHNHEYFTFKPFNLLWTGLSCCRLAGKGAQSVVEMFSSWQIGMSAVVS